MKQGYNARLDESLGGKHKGKHQQSFKDRRDESKAMSKKRYGHAYGMDTLMAEIILWNTKSITQKVYTNT